MTEECREELVKEALELMKEAMRSYLASNCKRTLSMIRLTEQKRVRLEFYGLFRHYTPSENFPRFMDAYSYIVRCRGKEVLSQVLGGELVESEDEYGYYVVIDSKKFEELCREALELAQE